MRDHCADTSRRCNATRRCTFVALAFAALTLVCVVPAIAQGSSGLTLELDMGQEFTIHYPPGWSVAPKTYANAEILVSVPDGGPTNDPTASRIVVTTEQRADHEDALRRLVEIKAEYDVTTTFREIGGWPALQRRFLHKVWVPKLPGPQEELRVDTAIAAGSLIVRLQGSVPPEMDPAPATDMEKIGRGVEFQAVPPTGGTERDLMQLRVMPVPRAPAVAPAPEGDSGSKPIPPEPAPEALGGFVQRVQTGVCNGGANFNNPCADNNDCPGSTCSFNGGDAEIEVAASIDGRTIVVVNNGRDFATSNDGGATFPFRGRVPDQAGLGNGDPSVAFGASGNVYFAFIDRPADSMASQICSTGIARSTNSGQTFNFLANATACNDNCFPDQEHIAADRYNLSGTSQDQVYSAWRDFTGGGCGGNNGTAVAGPEVPSLVCSTDGGQNWTPKIAVGAGGDQYARVTVGRDGSVYAVYLSGGSIVLNKFSSCASGLVQAGAPFPQTIAVHTPVDCSAGLPGVDRCNGRNTLASPVIAADESNPNHLFLAYASNTVALTNEDIFVHESTDGGENWSAGVRVNAPINARRYMPWVCTVGGEAHVTWYDRRFSTPADNSLTDFYRGVATNDGGSLVAGNEVQLTRASDSNCGSGWPSAVNATTDSESCTSQPQLGGICQDAMGNNFGRCDFSDCGGAGMNGGGACQCNAGEVCNIGRGGPKYGDYNGNACAAGRVYASWASATAGPNVNPPSTSIDAFFTQTLVCCEPQIQIPGGVFFDAVCPGDSDVEILEVCNTGKEDLFVEPITSSDPQISVDTPSAGYPVVISPDFCFPFRVRFTPDGSGDVSATLTIPSNDIVNPTVQVAAEGDAGEPNIVTAIADSGDFGDVCLEEHADLDLTISNSGNCDLTVTNISSNNAEFQVPGVLTYPIVIAPGDSVRVPIRLAPTSLGPKAGTITVTSDDPDTPMRQVQVSGNTPSGDVRVTGSTDFGDVCAEELAEKTVSVCNVGHCNLEVISAMVDCPDFTLINNPFPATVSPDSCMDVVVRFTPTSAGPKECDLTITTDDPDTPVIVLTLTANTPLASIDVPPDVGFPPTVIQSHGSCSAALPFPVSNTGQCNLEITEFEVSENPDEYSLSALPSFPIILEPGHVAGDGDLRTVFEPLTLDRDLLGELTVTWVSDPITGDTMTTTRAVCGEGTRTGARILVTADGVPVEEVKAIKLNRINANRNGNLVDTVDNARNLPLQMVTPDPPCAPFRFHREYGTIDNPVQLLPGSYQITVSARINGSLIHKTIAFDVRTCEFNPQIRLDMVSQTSAPLSEKAGEPAHGGAGIDRMPGRR